MILRVYLVVIMFYPDQTVTNLQKRPIPRHVAIIMDGNRRWARKRLGVDLFQGHWEGAKTLLNIIEASQEIGVKVFTVYAFSTENWSRSPQEIQALFHIIESYLKENEKPMVQKGIRFDTIGNPEPLPDSLQAVVKRVKESTKNGKGIDFIAALNYGGRDEIRRACVKLVEKKLLPQEITEEQIEKLLDTAPWGHPDLLIRTSGEMRVSNFLLWQMAYTEIFVTDVLWPDFTPENLLEAVLNFQSRERRRGI